MRDIFLQDVARVQPEVVDFKSCPQKVGHQDPQETSPVDSEILSLTRDDEFPVLCIPLSMKLYLVLAFQIHFVIVGVVTDESLLALVSVHLSKVVHVVVSEVFLSEEPLFLGDAQESLQIDL